MYCNRGVCGEVSGYVSYVSSWSHLVNIWTHISHQMCKNSELISAPHTTLQLSGSQNIFIAKIENVEENILMD